jgi:hypothetical protein
MNTTTPAKLITFTHLLHSHANPIVADSLPDALALGQLKKTQKKQQSWRRCLRFRKRRRGTAIVDTPKGILLVSEDGKTYCLPGGAAKGEESW